jgi:hypothetical protein
MGQQLALYQDFSTRTLSTPGTAALNRVATPLCAACRAKEARYGFRDEDDEPGIARPRTLCFECFRVEISRRQAIAARLARGWNATQVGLPLSETLERLDKRRRRAQIAARHALQLG